MSVTIVNDATCHDPWQNLATEESLLAACGPDDLLLFLWQNANTVVIGRHQNPWQECRHELLAQEGGKLARRITGGGAVYHDLGNLNFSFIAGRERYRLEDNLAVVLAAVRSLGVEAAFSGRNDILADGRKFSGNAFAHHVNASLHHGTLLVAADMERLSRYLQVPPQKMVSKGIQSVTSRVVNLGDLQPTITVEGLRQALCQAFVQANGTAATRPAAELVDAELLRAANQRQQSWEWRFGQTPRFDVTLTTRFPWGGVELLLNARDGRVTQAQCFSDAMDESFIAALPALFTGLPYSPAALARALRQVYPARQEADDLAGWLDAQSTL